MYVTLEPCCFQGRTPPCTQAIIDAGISEVHIALLDPNPKVSGKGLNLLQEAGIKTSVGQCEEKAREINESYIKFIETGLPFVIAKFAMSLDGKIATQNGDSKWISGDESRQFVHHLRHIVDAIMVGADTIIVDDPQLSARGCSGKAGRSKLQPLRIIIDGKGRTPLKARVFTEPGETLLVVAEPFDANRKKDFEKTGAEVVELRAEGDVIDLAELLNVLGEREISSILVEGGGTLFGSLFDHGLVDKVLAFVSPIIIGGESAKGAVGGRGVIKVEEALRLDRIKLERFGDDMLVSGYLGNR